MVNDNILDPGAPAVGSDPAPQNDDTTNSNKAPSSRDFRFALVSGVFFVIASILYLWLAFIDWDYQKMLEAIPEDVLYADDDYSWEGYTWEDDYVFDINNRVWVSYGQILYFAAALCFVIVGVLDFLYKPGHLFGVALIFAGLSGLVSAMLVEKDTFLSNVFNSISVHLYALEGVELLFLRPPVETLKYWPRIGDLFFLWGGLIDVALSYPIVWETYGTDHIPFAILASCTWLVSSLINLADIYFLRRYGGFGQSSMAAPADKEVEVERVEPAAEADEEANKP